LILRAQDSNTLGRNADLLGVAPGWFRVQLTTRTIVLDGWVQPGELSVGGALFGESIGLGSICSTSWSCYERKPGAQVVRPGWLVVGETPSAGSRHRIAIAAGTPVETSERRENGWIFVMPISCNIRPPDGQFFWIEEAMLQGL
jgi:hypothetical protein